MKQEGKKLLLFLTTVYVIIWNMTFVCGNIMIITSDRRKFNMAPFYLTVSTKSIYLNNDKKYNAMKSTTIGGNDFVVMKDIESLEEITVSLYEFKENFKLEEYVHGKTFCL